jgi:D-3-phosphoglycerate dehydrogenase / 2-oxoglutarate reductase
MSLVVLTDYAWAGVDIERRVVEGAGHRLLVGPAAAASAEAIAALARQHQPEAIMTCWAQVSAKAIAACPKLQIVARLGVGLDNIDVAAAIRQGAVVTNVPVAESSR